MSREYDPQTDGTALALMSHVLSMSTSGARKTFDETYDSYRQLRDLIDEHDKVTTSNRLDESLKVWACWSITDVKTKARAEARAELSMPAGRTVEKMRAFTEEPHEENRNESVHSRMGKGDPMGVGAVSCPEGQGEQEKYMVSEVIEWLQQTGGEDYLPPPVPDASWERPDNHMDAMVKGKCKKKARVTPRVEATMQERGVKTSEKVPGHHGFAVSAEDLDT